jgi:hypothetical protein
MKSSKRQPSQQPPQETAKVYFTRRVAILLLLAAPLVFLGDLLMTGRIFLLRDTVCDFAPMQKFTSDSLLSGVIPFWCPSVGMGKPFVGDFFPAVFYPPNLVFLLFPLSLALKLSWLTHFWIASFGAYFLARSFNVSRGGAIAAAWGFAFGSWTIGLFEYLISFTVLAWVPFTVALAIRFINSDQDAGIHPLRSVWQSRRLAIALTGVFTMQIFANYAEMVLYPLCAPALYIVLCAIRGRSWRPFMSGGIFMAISFLLACLITIPQLLPMVEFIPFSERAGKFDARFEMASMHPSQWISLISPFLSGRPGYPAMYWASTSYEFWTGTIYLGLLPLLLIPFALLWISRKSPVRFADRNHAAIFGFLMILAGSVLAAGMHTPIYQLVYEYVPGFNRFRFPTKWLIIVILGAIPLIAAGWDAVFSPKENNRPRRLFAVILTAEAIGGLVLIVFAGLVLSQPEILASYFPAISKLNSPDTTFARNDLLAGTGWYLGAFALILAARFLPGTYAASRWIPGLAIAFCLANILTVARAIHPVGSDATYEFTPTNTQAEALQSPLYRTYSAFTSAQQYLYANPNESVYRWAREAGIGDAWLPYKIQLMWQGGPKTLAFNKFLGAIQSSPPELGDRLANLVSLKYVVAGTPAEEVLWANREPQLNIRERPNAYPRIRFATNWEPVQNSDEVFESVLRGRFLKDIPKVENTALVNGRPRTEKVPQSQGGLPTAEPPQLIKEDANTLVIEANSDTGGLLVVGDLWYPGWKAEANGKRLPVYRVEGVFRGVFLEPGKQIVRLSYLPNGFFFYCGISGLTLTLIAWAFFTRRGNPTAA